MKKRSIRIATFSLFVALFSGNVQADVFVSDIQRFEVLNENVELPANHYVARPLSLTAGDKLEIKLDIHNRNFADLSLVICDSRQINQYFAGQAAGCYGVEKGKGQIQFDFVAQYSGDYSLILDNTYANFIRKSVSLQAYKTFSLSPSGKKQVVDFLEGLDLGLQTIFVVQKFDLAVSPCGFENAFSVVKSGSIGICSELMLRLLRDQRVGALLGIVFHEVGHSLLNLWHLPGGDNEQTVDEFAVYMFYIMGRQEMAFDMAKYFEEANSASEAYAVLFQDTRHPISIQRSRNIHRILQNPKSTIERWNNFIYPHLTKQALEGVIDNPGVYGNRTLAQQYLNDAK